MKKMKILLALVAFASLNGCLCPCPPDSSKVIKPPLLPAVSSEQHIQRINQRSSWISTLRASGKVTITYPDKDGKPHSDTAEGALIIHRQPLRPGENEIPADVYYKVMLFGRVAGQDVFELGENDKYFWMASRIDPKTAHVARKDSPMVAESTDPAADAMPLRAGLIPLLLGIAPCDAGQFALTNAETIEVIALRRGGDFAPVSVVEISRYEPGDPVAVRLYRRDGVLEGEASLSDYRDVAYEGPTTRTPPPLRLPYKIVVTYPARKGKVELEISKWERAVMLKDAAYLMPDFEKQGLKVNPGKAP